MVHIIKRPHIEMETISNPSRECFPMLCMVKTTKRTTLKVKKEVDPHTVCLKATMRKIVWLRVRKESNSGEG